MIVHDAATGDPLAWYGSYEGEEWYRIESAQRCGDMIVIVGCPGQCFQYIQLCTERDGKRIKV